MEELSKSNSVKSDTKSSESSETQQVGMEGTVNNVVYRFLVMVASVVVIGYGVSIASKIIGPLFLALFLAIILLVPLQWMQKKGCPKIIALIIVIVFTVIVFVGISYHVAKSLNYLVAKSPEYKAKLEAKITAIDKRLEQVGIASGLTAWWLSMENKNENNTGNENIDDDENDENNDTAPKLQINENNNNNRFNNSDNNIIQPPAKPHSTPLSPSSSNSPSAPSTSNSSNKNIQDVPNEINLNKSKEKTNSESLIVSPFQISEQNLNSIDKTNSTGNNKSTNESAHKTNKESVENNTANNSVKIVNSPIATLNDKDINNPDLIDKQFDNKIENNTENNTAAKISESNIRNDNLDTANNDTTNNTTNDVNNNTNNEIETRSLSDFLGGGKVGFGFLKENNDNVNTEVTAKSKRTSAAKEKSQQLILLQSQDVMRWLQTSLFAIREIGESTFLVLIFTIFMIFEAASFPTKIDRAFGLAGPINNQHLQRIAGDIRRYLFLKAISSMMSATAATIVYWFFGVPAMFFWGLVAFFLYFIPNVGGILASIIPGLLIFMTYDWQGVAIYAVCLVGIECTIGYGIEPKMLGHGLGISTVVILLSLFTWGMLLGPIGLFMAAPLTIMVKITLQAFKETEWIATLIDRK
jgi:predicted PurR-regulated permease PerM